MSEFKILDKFTFVYTYDIILTLILTCVSV